MAINIQQIHAIADQLQDQGIKPTLAEVRKALGGGSFTTISEAMKSWRQDNREEEQLRQVDLPSGINERLQSLGADVWQTAINMANDRLVKEREALDAIKVKAQAETDEAQEAVKTLEGEQSDLLGQLDEVTATAETAATKLEKTEAERDTFKKTLDATEHQLELERIKADTAQTQLAEVRSALDKTSADLAANLSKVTKLETIADSNKAEIERLKSELANTKTELKTVTAERNEIQTKTAEVKGELKAITAERNKLSEQSDQLTQTQAKLEVEHRVLNEKYSELSNNYLSEQEQVTALRAELEKTQSELATYQNQNKNQNAD
ncbi:DNA-binding protein [Psychrobacter aquimaris]|uniref:DNA-binding protein n=1 Tax=Psychrobacter TaxID=497 RepID=UPI003FD4D867